MITECGIFGTIYSKKNKNTIVDTINGLDLLQHRGRESAGLAYWKVPVSKTSLPNADNFINTKKNNVLVTIKNKGFVKDVFSDFLRDSLNYKFKINSCIGHVRYSTSGKKNNSQDLYSSHIQPLLSETVGEKFALSYNGNIKNIDSICAKYDIPPTNIDTQMIIHIIQKINKSTLEEKLIQFMKDMNGVFCLLIMTEYGIYALRDSYGVRPLCYGALSEEGNNGNNSNNINDDEQKGYCITSESCALQHFEFIREIEPGEILYFGRKMFGNKMFHMKQIFQLKRKPQNIQKCIFEYIYFMNEKSYTNKSLYDIRFQIGEKIASDDIELLFNEKSDLSNFLVVGCPLTGIPYGKGYSNKTGITYSQILQKKSNCGRTFILPENNSRLISCKKNLFISKDIVGKDLIILDDSLVRGNTIATVIQKLREHGAASIHIRITSPPVISPCYFGVDIPTKEELIAHSNSIEEIRCKIGADTLSYAPLDIIKHTIQGSQHGFCSACFDGNYKDELLDW